jgi:tetratricopeptide (TPR) repeat protein
MTANDLTLPDLLSRWATGVVTLLLALAVTAPAALAQENQNQNQQQQQQLEQLKEQYAQAVQAAKQNNATTAYEHFERALELAQATEQQGAAQKIQQFLVQLPRQWGNEALKNQNYEEALTHFNKGLENDSTQARLHYGKGIALINLDQEEAAMQSLSTAIERGEQSGDQRTVQTARTRIQEHYVALASQVLNAQDPTQAQAEEALGYLNQMEEYVEPSANAYFYRATALYHQDQYEDAISAARQGLELFEGSRSDEAKFHFVIGESYVALNNIEAAKEEFRQAAYGDYAPRAEHYLETL